MKHLVDSCGWIEWLTDGKLASKYAHYLKKPDELVMPTIIQYELYKWTLRERDEDFALKVIGYTNNANIIVLDSRLALLAGDIAIQLKLTMADSIVYATSTFHNVQLITSDAHFKDLDCVKYFKK